MNMHEPCTETACTQSLDDITCEVASLVAECTQRKREEIDLSASLISGELEMSSIELLTLLVALEEKFHIKISEEDITEEMFSSINVLAQTILAQSSPNA